MAISYEEAQSMFTPQGYNSQQLDAVLRHHGGHMENTVETLLNHGEGTPDELMNKLQSIPVGNNSNNSTANSNSNADTLPGEVHQHNIDADEELARQLAAEDERDGRSGNSRLSTQNNNNRGSPTRSNLGLGLASAMGRNRLSPGERRPMASNITSPSRQQQQQPTRQQPATQQTPAGTKGIGISTQLPSDFLRIPGRIYPNNEGRPSNNEVSSDPIASAAGPVGQMMSDEQLARMLQDELFQEELRNNPEFSHLAGRRNPRSITSDGGGRQTTGRSTYSGAQGGSGANDFFEDLGDNLSKLGDVAKRRFQDFAASWNDPNRQSNQSSRPLFGGGGGRSQTNVNTGNERRGLLADDLNMEDEGEELDFVGSGGNSTSNNFFEMNDVGDKKKD